VSDLATLEAERATVHAEIERQWWIFCKCKKASPVQGHLYVRRNELDREIRALKRATCGDFDLSESEK
jgi:hypothetical protein